MKKFTLLCLLFVLSVSVFGQNMSKEHYESLSDANKELYQRLLQQQAQREARVQSYMLNNGISRNYTNANGRFFHIRDIVNGQPIYIATDNVDAAIATKTDQLQVGGALGLDLDGTGMVVAVWDGGPVDNLHPEFSDANFISRITQINFSEQYVGGAEHATHVAGTIAASGVSPAAKGMATNVAIKSYDFFNDYVEMTSAVTDINDPLYLSNHSYGVPVSNYVTTNQQWVMGAYTEGSRDIDELAYNNPKYLAVFTAGNDGNAIYAGQNFAGLDKLTGDKTGKNNLVIANANPSVSGGNLFLSINNGSSQGPTDDLRVKPDIAADGTNLFSTEPGGTYGLKSGTSMSAPNTTGTLVLLQQYYNQLNGGDYMNSATLKAIVCHTAVDDNVAGPDPRFGWGFLDAKASAEVISGANADTAVLEELTLENNDTYRYTFTAGSGSKLSATIVWTDLPGALSNGVLNDPTPALVNDLDLRITKDGTTFLPWRLSLSTIGGIENSKGDNSVDNVERIDIDMPDAGEYALTVTHKGTLQGISNNQNFSLVITGNNLSLGVDDNVLSQSLDVFPNPSHGEFMVSFNTQSSKDVKVNIYDLSGREVYSASFDNRSPQFNQILSLSDIQPGVYIANITEGNNSASHKIIIE